MTAFSVFLKRFLPEEKSGNLLYLHIATKFSQKEMVLGREMNPTTCIW